MNQENQAASTVAAKINNQELVIISENANKFVPIKPICDALGIDYPTQYQKLKEDEDLVSTIGLRPMVAADGKQREMVCLPLKYIFGWLFTISPKNVAPEAKELVRRYRTECYDALYRYFTARAEFVELKQKEIDRQLTIVEEAKHDFREAKNVLNEAESKLKGLRQLTMEDYDAERKQLKINFDH